MGGKEKRMSSFEIKKKKKMKCEWVPNGISKISCRSTVNNPLFIFWTYVTLHVLWRKPYVTAFRPLLYHWVTSTSRSCDFKNMMNSSRGSNGFSAAVCLYNNDIQNCSEHFAIVDLLFVIISSRCSDSRRK